MNPVDRQAEVRRAAAARDAARARLRRATAGTVAVAVALSGAFAALAAGSTHPAAKVAVRLPRRHVRKLPPLTTAPPAPLVSAEAAAPAAQAAPASAPTQSYAPPVVVSGGS